MPEKVRKSSGNVFRDLGIPPAEAENLRVRTDLMMQVEKLIEVRGWTQSEAAKHLGVSKRRISDLLHGKIERFSADSLIEMFGRAGYTVTVGARRRSRVA